MNRRREYSMARTGRARRFFSDLVLRMLAQREALELRFKEQESGSPLLLDGVIPDDPEDEDVGNSSEEDGVDDTVEEDADIHDEKLVCRWRK